MTAPAAQMSIGSISVGVGLYGTPRAGAVPVAGTVALLLGDTDEGRPVIVVAPSLEWLDQLESAIQVERARAVLEAGTAVTW